MAKIIRVKADVKFIQMFVCNGCGAERPGDTMYMEYDGSSALNLHFSLQNVPLSPHKMPIGWANSNDEGINCSRCIKKW